MPQPPDGTPAQSSVESENVAQVPVLGAPTCCITSGGGSPARTEIVTVSSSGVRIEVWLIAVNDMDPGPVIVNVTGSDVETLPVAGDVAPGLLEKVHSGQLAL